MKRAGWIALCFFMVSADFAQAQNATNSRPLRRGGAALQIGLDGGGDYLHEFTDTNMTLGEGVSFSAGGFYRPVETSPLEIYGLVGAKLGFFAPIQGAGYDSNVKRWTAELLANYRFNNKWYVDGGLVYHINPRFYDDNPAATDVQFKNALGATVGFGWSFIGVQYTYMEYSSAAYGHFDASNVGLRFTVRFRKWRPVF